MNDELQETPHPATDATTGRWCGCPWASRGRGRCRRERKPFPVELPRLRVGSLQAPADGSAICPSDEMTFHLATRIRSVWETRFDAIQRQEFVESMTLDVSTKITRSAVK